MRFKILTDSVGSLFLPVFYFQILFLNDSFPLTEYHHVCFQSKGYNK